jgi:hypothetical protein
MCRQVPRIAAGSAFSAASNLLGRARDLVPVDGAQRHEREGGGDLVDEALEAQLRGRVGLRGERRRDLRGHPQPAVAARHCPAHPLAQSLHHRRGLDRGEVAGAALDRVHDEAAGGEVLGVVGQPVDVGEHVLPAARRDIEQLLAVGQSLVEEGDEPLTEVRRTVVRPRDVLMEVEADGLRDQLTTAHALTLRAIRLPRGSRVIGRRNQPRSPSRKATASVGASGSRGTSVACTAW